MEVLGEGELDECGQKVQIYSFDISTRYTMHNMMTIAVTTVWHV